MTRICDNCRHFAKEPNAGGRGCCFMSDDIGSYPVVGDCDRACDRWQAQLMPKGVYRFADNLKADENTLEEQMDKTAEELDEVLTAWVQSEPNERIIEELWDTIQAAEGVLRKYAYPEVVAGYYAVIDKCKARGDYAL